MKLRQLKRRDPHALDAKLRKASQFLDRKKEANRKSCRGKVNQEN